MNLWDIQAAVKAALQAHPSLAGVPVLLDDGTYDRTPGRESALKTAGVVMIVWQIASFGIPAQARDGVAAHLVYVPVVIEENVVRNRSGGLGSPWERLLQHGLEALSGRHQDRFQFEMYDPAWQHLGKVDGVNRVVLNILCARVSAERAHLPCNIATIGSNESQPSDGRGYIEKAHKIVKFRPANIRAPTYQACDCQSRRTVSASLVTVSCCRADELARIAMYPTEGAHPLMARAHS